MKIKFNNTIFALLLIILVAAFFRLYNINWDQGTHLHPDERAIVLYALPLSWPTSLNQFLSPESPLNPHFFAYGNFPLYFLKVASYAASFLDTKYVSYDGIELVGRFVSTIADLFTIFLIFKIGSVLFDKITGLAGAFLYSVSVFPIQASHFYAVDILLTFFVTLTLWRILKFYQKSNLLNAALIGITFGLSLVTKVSSIPLIIAISFAIVSDFLFIFLKSPHKPKHWLPHIPKLIKRLLTEGVIIAITTAVTFTLLQPYAIIDFTNFLGQNLQQSQMTRDAYTFPYTLQYVGIIPYFYPLKNLFLWGMGPVIATICGAGIFYYALIWKKFKNNNEILVIVSFLVLYFAVVGHFAIGFMRYMLPIYPVLSIFGGLFLSRIIYQKIQTLRLIKIPLVIVLTILILIWPLSFMSIYTHENSRIAASRWILQNIPYGKTLTHEVWDDQLPLYNASNYLTLDLPLYDQPDNDVKWLVINDKLEQADYVIIASNRLSAPIQRLADCKKYKVCFPTGSQFYKNLFDGKLGFRQVARFNSFPTIPILGIKINDQQADESFTVYDHPEVFIFKNTNRDQVVE